MMMTTKQFLNATSILLNIYGEAVLAMKRKNVTEIPQEIWPMNPSRWDEKIKKIGEKDVLVGWEYTGSSTPIPFGFQEILFPRYYNPYSSNGIRGLSPLRAAKLSIEQHFYSSKYNKNFFKNGVRVSGFISIPDSLEDDSYNRLISQFEESHAGVDRQHRVAIIEGGGTFSESRITQKDMEFIDLNKLSRIEVFATLHTNEVVLGIYDAVQSYEGMRQAYKQFWEDCMVPHVMFLEEFWNENFFKLVNGGRVRLKFDLASVGALHDDYKVRIETAKVMTNIGFPLNAVNERLELGMKPVPWGDTWYVPWGAIPVDQVLNPKTNPNNPQNNPNQGGEEQEDETDDSEDTTTEDNKPEDDELSKQMWNRYVSSQLILEDIVRNKVKRYLFEQRK
jgi:HK97 family phage portal protein